jgi:hypothetical protein
LARAAAAVAEHVARVDDIALVVTLVRVRRALNQEQGLRFPTVADRAVRREAEEDWGR